MTQTEFETYLASYKKVAGTYSDEELYQIGKTYKLSVASKDKSWSWLCTEVGYPGSKEAYRKYVNYRIKKDDFVAKAIGDTVTSSSDKVDLFEQEKNLYKERTKLNDVYNRYRETLRDEARIDAFREEVLKEARASKPIKPMAYKGPHANKHREAVLVLSDFHIGDKTNNFYNKYDLEIATLRVEELIRQVKDYCIEMGVDLIHILNLGDMVDGVIHRRPMSKELKITKQLRASGDLYTKIINELRAIAKVDYRSCTDNHARLNQNKDENIEAENLNDILTWHLEGRFEDDKNVKIISDNPDPSFGFFQLRNGKKIIFAHGHLEKTNRAIDTFQTAMKQFIDYVILGHYHAAKEKSFGGAKLLGNGSLIGVNDYALEHRLFDRAEQKLLIFDDNHPTSLLNFSIDVQDIGQ